jgi:hypothetical protein
MHSLEAELTSKKDVQRQLLENIFKGLRYFLDDFSELIPKGINNTHNTHIHT